MEIQEAFHRISYTCPNCGARTLDLAAVSKKNAPLRVKDVLGVLLILVSAACATAGTWLFFILSAFARLGSRDAAIGKMTLLWLGGWLCLLAAGFVLTHAGGKRLVGPPAQALAAFGLLLVFGLSMVIFVCITPA